MADLSTAAGMIRLGLRVGVFSPLDAIRWAEAVVAASDAPPVEVLDLAVVPEGRWVEIESALGAIAGRPTERMGRLLMALLAERVDEGSLVLAQAVNLVYSLGTQIFDFDDALPWQTWSWMYDDIEHGYGDRAQIEGDFRAFLRGFLPQLAEARAALKGCLNGADGPPSPCPGDAPRA